MTVLIVSKSLAVLQLLLTLHPSQRLAHAASTPTSPITRAGFQFVTAQGDYDDDYDGDYPDQLSRPRSAAPARPDGGAAPPELCRYDPCLEDQPPCAALAAQNGCLCPGLSGAAQPPRPPRLQGLLPPGDGDLSCGPVVRWCAPSSVVTGYRVVVDGDRGAALEFPALGRRGQLVVALEAGAEVCVEAVNGAGHSAASELSCTRYRAPPGGLSGSGTLGLIGGGVALLLLLVVMALALHRRRRARRRNTEAGAEGLGNPSYSAEGHL